LVALAQEIALAKRRKASATTSLRGQTRILPSRRRAQPVRLPTVSTKPWGC